MKKLALVIMMLIPALCWSQSTSRSADNPVVISNWDRLHVDFEIKNNNNPSVELVALIQLDQYDLIRQEHTDVEVHDQDSGYTLVIYSKTKTFQIKNNHPNSIDPQLNSKNN